MAAPRWCAACGHGIAADKGNSLVRHARTAHRAAAHYAWLTLKEGGENSRRPLGSLCEGAGWAAKLHRLRELLPPPLRGTSLGEGGENSHRPYGAPPSGRKARTPTAPTGHLPRGGRQVLSRARRLCLRPQPYSLYSKIRCKRRRCVMPCVINHSRKQGFHAIKWLQKASLRYALCYKSLAQAGFPCARAPHSRIPALMRKSEGGDAILLPSIAAERKHAVSRRRVRGLSLKITKIFPVSSGKICEIR